MATVTTERITIEKPVIEQIAQDESLLIDDRLPEDKPEAEITQGGFWSKAASFLGNWSEKNGEHMVKTGYWNLYRM